jgi:hypothetical protein
LDQKEAFDKRAQDFNYLAEIETKQKGADANAYPKASPFKRANVEESKVDSRQRHLLEFKRPNRGSRKFRTPSPNIVRRAKELEDHLLSMCFYNE